VIQLHGAQRANRKGNADGLTPMANDGGKFLLKERDMTRAAIAALLTVAVMMDAGLAMATTQFGQGTAKAKKERAPERVICKTDVDTGSLARRTRRCFTRAQWTQIANAARTGTEEVLDRNRDRAPGE